MCCDEQKRILRLGYECAIREARLEAQQGTHPAFWLGSMSGLSNWGDAATSVEVMGHQNEIRFLLRRHHERKNEGRMQ